MQSSSNTPRARPSACCWSGNDRRSGCARHRFAIACWAQPDLRGYSSSSTTSTFFFAPFFFFFRGFSSWSPLRERAAKNATAPPATARRTRSTTQIQLFDFVSVLVVAGGEVAGAADEGVVSARGRGGGSSFGGGGSTATVVGSGCLGGGAGFGGDTLSSTFAVSAAV